MAEAADFLRNGGEAYREMMVLRGQMGEDLIQHSPIIGDQLALGAAFERIAERIEARAAQEFHLRQQPKSWKHPRAETHLTRQTGRLVAARKQRRREMEFEPQIIAIELAFDLLLEGAVGI